MNYLNILSVMILVSSFMLMANKRTKSYINSFRFQSFLIALSAGVMGSYNLAREGEYDLLIICLITLVLKVIYIPNLLRKTISRVGYIVEKDFFLNIPILILICCGLVVFSYFTVASIDGLSLGQTNIYVVNSISVVLIGMFFMITRKKAIGQIVGFLVIENGLFTAGMFLTHGMPIVVDIGIFIDLFTAVMIMGLMVFNINDKFQSINTHKLKKLRG